MLQCYSHEAVPLSQKDYLRIVPHVEALPHAARAHQRRGAFSQQRAHDVRGRGPPAQPPPTLICIITRLQPQEFHALDTQDGLG